MGRGAQARPWCIEFIIVLILLAGDGWGASASVADPAEAGSALGGAASAGGGRTLLAEVPREFIITNSTIQSVLRTVSNADGEVIFTTIHLPNDPSADLSMLQNFCYWLDRSNALQHLLILTTSARTWTLIRALGFPVYLDRAFPEREEYRIGNGNARDTPNRVFDVQKHWWGWTVIRHGYRALYMDSDAIVLRDPFEPFQREDYDVQGLSDWTTAELPRTGAVVNKGCGLYFMIADAAVPGGSILREWWRFPAGWATTHLAFHNPCQSTGTWYLKPTPPAVAFMAALSARLLTPGTRHQWDQTAWNEVVVAHLWGSGDDPPLRYRLLPHSLAANVNVHDARVAAGAPMNLVVLHSGYLHGAEKVDAYTRLGVWRPDFNCTQRPVAQGPARRGAVPSRATADPGVEPRAAVSRGAARAVPMALFILAVGILIAVTIMTFRPARTRAPQIPRPITRASEVA